MPAERLGRPRSLLSCRKAEKRELLIPTMMSLVKPPRMTVLAFAGALMASAASGARAEPIVIVNSTHTLAFAEAACKNQREPDAVALCGSVGDPRHLGRILENTLISKFAVTEQCKGVLVALLLEPKYDGNYNQAALELREKDHWELFVDYTPIGTSYTWALMPEPFEFTGGRSLPSIKSKSGDRHAVEGEGTPAQIVREVCIAVTGQGANVR